MPSMTQSTPRQPPPARAEMLFGDMVLPGIPTPHFVHSGRVRPPYLGDPGQPYQSTLPTPALCCVLSLPIDDRET
ncbi:uncharacterized protein LY79DRAFT_564163 [Colletotrichum navitas]|uniref:Uncharacterized protein n=1 Tax=Colletotrichum navitas TaxID=681940 RepID=A0AAD8V278_9PEZI|nr:uncharacterized protein LY79DRAFT_564163 [Colletotrichum navitas]KAK1579444.1 hypothetical protein LY79DRAFT_564163 [Colletotrichum navitas]